MRAFLIIVSFYSLLACKSLGVVSADDAPYTNLYIDELEQLYTVSSNNTIRKFDREGKLQFEYSDNTLGPITNFDVSNPLQLLVFHKNFQTVKIFDRTLNLTTQIDLNKLDLFEIQTVASSNDNRIWVFDELNQELLKIDKNGNIQGRNNDLRLRLKTNATPYFMVEYQNMVYMFDKEHGLLIFNNFGEFISKRTFFRPQDFRYAQGILFYQEYTDLVTYQIENAERVSVYYADKFQKGSNHYILDEKTIYLEGEKIFIKE